MIKIGVITAPHSISEIKQIEPQIKNHCELTFIPYLKLTEIKDLYEQNRLYYDGILFSGELGYKTLQQDYPKLETPVYFLDITEGDFYKRLFAISNANKNLNFARVSMDLINKENNFIGLEEILNENEFPYALKLEFSEALYETAFRQHLSLWEQGKIDLVITRVSNVVGQLKQAGIPTIFIFPSKESILEQVKQIMNELQISNLLENQWAIGMITLENQEVQSDIEFKQILLHKALLEFNEKENAFSIIQRKHTCFEIITSQADLRKLTNEFLECTILKYLEGALPFRVKIGWGIGTTLYQAKKFALTANKQAQSIDFPCSFLITADEKVVGPLGSDTCLNYTNKADPHLEKLSKKLGLSILQTQKIIAAASKLQTNELTANDLSYYLGLTLRQANRILNKLEENGAVEITYRKQEQLRGRPKKVYKLNFLS